MFAVGDRVVFGGGNSTGRDIVKGDVGTVESVGEEILFVRVEGKRSTQFMATRWSHFNDAPDETESFFV